MADKYMVMSNLSDVIPEFHGSPYVINNNLIETPYTTHGQVFGKGGYSLKDMKDALEYADNGYVYQVKTPPQDFYLQFEKPLSQQSQTVQNILKENGLYDNPNQLGKDLYHKMLKTYKDVDLATAKNSLNNELNMYGIKGSSINYPFLGQKGEWKVTYQPEDVKVIKQMPVSEVKEQLKKPIVPSGTKLRKEVKPIVQQAPQSFRQISNNIVNKGLNIIKNPSTYTNLTKGIVTGLVLDEALKRTFINPWQVMNNPRQDNRSETDKAIMKARFGI